jgi:hypothetical protein
MRQTKKEIEEFRKEIRKAHILSYRMWMETKGEAACIFIGETHAFEFVLQRLDSIFREEG